MVEIWFESQIGTAPRQIPLVAGPKRDWRGTLPSGEPEIHKENAMDVVIVILCF